MIKHGHAVGKETPTYKSWLMMKQRCNNPQFHKYSEYGGRGITICERWASFEVFVKDMGERPPAHSIERLNNDGHYEPANCIWATRKAQQRNRRVCRRVEYLGNDMTLFEAVSLSKTKIPYSTIYFRLRPGWDLLKAMHQPISHTGRPRKAVTVRERVGA
jgi:hypothetical protein